MTLHEMIESKRKSGLKVLLFDDTIEPNYTLATGCLLIEQPDLRLLEAIETTPALKRMWESKEERTELHLWLHKGFDRLYQKFFQVYQKDETEGLGRLLERMKLFRDHPMYLMCRDHEMRLPESHNMGLAGLSFADKEIVVASTFLGIPYSVYSFDEIYVPIEYVEKNHHLTAIGFYVWLNETDTKLFCMKQEAAPAIKKNFLARFRNKL